MKYSVMSLVRCIVSLCLVFAMIIPGVASAAVKPPVEPQASNYITSYYGYVSQSGSTVYTVFSITGTGTMDRIGSPEIYLYESADGVNYYLVKSYRSSNYPEMIGYNTGHHSGMLTYEGNANCTYKAYICVYAGRNGGGDARYFWAYQTS